MPQRKTHEEIIQHQGVKKLKARIQILTKVIDALLESGLVSNDIEFWIKRAMKKHPGKKKAKEIIEEWPKWKQDICCLWRPGK